MKFLSPRSAFAALILFWLAIFCTVQAYANPVAVSWDHPTQYVDGQPLPLTDIGSTQIECIRFIPTQGTPIACTVAVATVAAPANSTSIDVGTVPRRGGAYEFVARTCLTWGTCSDNSVAAQRVYAPVKPRPPMFRTVPVAQGIDFSPVYRVLANGRAGDEPIGFVRAGVTCDGPALFTKRGQAYRRIGTEQIAWWSEQRPAIVAAACGESEA